MKPRTRFIKYYYKTPERARRELIYQKVECNPMGDNWLKPYSLNVIYVEIFNKTKLGDLFLEELGFSEVKNGNNATRRTDGC